MVKISNVKVVTISPRDSYHLIEQLRSLGGKLHVINFPKDNEPSNHLQRNIIAQKVSRKFHLVLLDNCSELYLEFPFER